MIKKIETDNYIELDENIKTVVITKNFTNLFNMYVKKHKTIVATPFTLEEVELTVEHNNCHLLLLDANNLTKDQIEQFIQVYEANEFSNDERHVRRIKKMEKLWKKF